MTNLSSFDLDFQYGSAGEGLVFDLLAGNKTVEVKRDRRWKETGNIYIETECYFTKSSSWKPSGLSVTEAGYWAFVLEESVILLPTSVLRFAVHIYGRPISCQIPPNLSKGFLIKPEELITATKEYSGE